MTKVYVPDPGWQAGDNVTDYWHGTGGWIDIVRHALGHEMAYSVMLSALARHMRRDFGVDEAKLIFRQFADTMDEAAKLDRTL